MTKNLERQIEWDEFDKIIHTAETMQHIEERNGELREAYAELEPFNGDMAPLTIGRLYETAKDLKISDEFVDKAITLYHPSKEQQREILKKNGATSTREVVMESYENRLVPLFEEIEKTVPNKEFGIKEDYWGLTINEMRDLNLSNRLKTVWKENLLPTCLFGKIPRALARLDFISTTNIKIRLYDPLFLQICEETLENLKKEFNTSHDFTYHHNPHD